MMYEESLPPLDKPRILRKFRCLFRRNYEDEPFYDIWTRFKNKVQRFPDHGIDLRTLTQLLYDYISDDDQLSLSYHSHGKFRELSGEEAWEIIENFAAGHDRREKPITKQDEDRLRMNAKRFFGDENLWLEMRRDIEIQIKFFGEYTPPVGDLETMEDKVKYLSPLDIYFFFFYFEIPLK